MSSSKLKPLLLNPAFLNFFKMNYSSTEVKRSDKNVIQKFIFLICFCLILSSNRIIAQTSWTDQVYSPDQKNIENNPLKGIIPGYNYYNNNFPYSTEHFYIALNTTFIDWNNFDWKTFESELNRVSAKGCHAVPRFYIDFPGREYAMPKFLQSLVPAHNYTDNGNTTSKSPYWNTDTLIYALEQFAAAYGAKYDGDPRLGAVEIGLYGFWGEMHNYPHDDWDMVIAKRDRLVKAFTKSFTKTHVQIRYPAIVSTVDLRNAVGYYDDSYLVATVGADSWDFWNLMVKNGATEAWKKHPMGGESMTAGTPLASMWDNWPNTVGNDISTCIKTTHHSWFVDHSTFDQTLTAVQWTNKMKVHKMLGYQFFASSVQIILDSLNTITAKVKIQNKGVAPFYYNWKVEFLALSTSTNWSGMLGTADWGLDSIVPVAGDYLKTFISGKELPIGKYKILMRFVNPLETISPLAKKLRFANQMQDADKDGWLTLGTVEVKTGFETSSINIDGNLNDWTWINPIVSGSEQSTQNIKVFADTKYLYFAIAGSNLGPNFQLYLNTDNNTATGFQVANFSSSGADYRIQGTSLSVYKGTGSWSDVSATVDVSKNSGATEIRIPRSVFTALSNTIQIAYVDVDSNGNAVSQLGFSSFSILSEAPVSIVTDGNLSDWSSVSPVATASGQTAQSLKVHCDAMNIYFAVEGSGLGANYQIYLNTDKDTTTGFQHWLFPSGSGAEYMIQDGVLMKPTAQTGWSWATIPATVLSFQNQSITEVQIPRSSIGLLSDTLYVAYVDITSDWKAISELGFAPFLNSIPVKIQDIAMPSEVSIFPNPASETLNITLGESGGLALINIYNIYGQLIYSERTTNSQTKVNVSGLKTKGLVIVRVDKSHGISNMKVVLQ